MSDFSGNPPAYMIHVKTYKSGLRCKTCTADVVIDMFIASYNYGDSVYCPFCGNEIAILIEPTVLLGE